MSSTGTVPFVNPETAWRELQGFCDQDYALPATRIIVTGNDCLAKTFKILRHTVNVNPGDAMPRDLKRLAGICSEYYANMANALNGASLNKFEVLSTCPDLQMFNDKPDSTLAMIIRTLQTMQVGITMIKTGFPAEAKAQSMFVEAALRKIAQEMQDYAESE